MKVILITEQRLADLIEQACERLKERALELPDGHLNTSSAGEMYCLGAIELHTIRLKLVELGMAWAGETHFTKRMHFAFRGVG